MHLVGLDGLSQGVHDELSRHIQGEVWGREALDGLDVGAVVADGGNIGKGRSRMEIEMVWDDGMSTTGRWAGCVEAETCGRQAGRQATGRQAGRRQTKSKVKTSGAAAAAWIGVGVKGGKGVMAADGGLRRTDTQRHTTGVKMRSGEEKKEDKRKTVNTKQKQSLSYCAQEEDGKMHEEKGQSKLKRATQWRDSKCESRQEGKAERRQGKI